MLGTGHPEAVEHGVPGSQPVPPYPFHIKMIMGVISLCLPMLELGLEEARLSHCGAQVLSSLLLPLRAPANNSWPKMSSKLD